MNPEKDKFARPEFGHEASADPNSPENQELATDVEKGASVDAVTQLVHYSINQNPRSNETQHTPEGVMHVAAGSIGSNGEARIYDNGTNVTRFELVDRDPDTNEEINITILNPSSSPEILINGESETKKREMPKIVELMNILRQEEEAAKKAREEADIEPEQEKQASEVTKQAEQVDNPEDNNPNKLEQEVASGSPENIIRLDINGKEAIQPSIEVGPQGASAEVIDFQARSVKNPNNPNRGNVSPEQALNGYAKAA